MILTIAGKELRRLFTSPLAWVMLTFLQLILAWVFLGRLQTFLELQPQIAMMPAAPGVTEIVVAPVFGTATIVLLMVVPLLSMRLIAEERRNQTLPFLMSAPVSITQIVMGKFLGLLAFLALAVALPVLMAVSLYGGGKLDLGLLAGNVLGVLLLCSSFAAVGLYLSCLTAHPLVAGVGTFAVLLGLWLVNMSTSDPDSVLNVISLIKHYDTFARGTIALSDLVYYPVLTALFLLLSIRRLDADRLRA
jgi:gliding motility-associated transport system permease protein